MEVISADPTGQAPSAEHSMRLTAYLELGLDDVLALFARPEIDEVLGSAIRAASGSTDARLTIDAAGPVRVSASNARVAATWRVLSHAGRVSEGSATVSLLMVQSGTQPVTELLVSLTVDDDQAVSAAAVAHRFLEEVSDRLSMLAASPVVSVGLRDGTTVDLHPMHADDAAALLRFHHRLSPETTNLRFFNVHPELSVAELQRFTHVDHRDREAIVAAFAGEIVGVARFDRLDDPLEAEAAFVVADSWQGRGVGVALFDRLAARAREVGIARLVADTMPHNRRMLAVFRHGGQDVRSSFRDGLVHVVIDLVDQPTRSSSPTTSSAVASPVRDGTSGAATGTFVPTGDLPWGG
jgi:RimJ/RimL family protein N-acetyltransferase